MLSSLLNTKGDHISSVNKWAERKKKKTERDCPERYRCSQMAAPCVYSVLYHMCVLSGFQVSVCIHPTPLTKLPLGVHEEHHSNTFDELIECAHLIHFINYAVESGGIRNVIRPIMFSEQFLTFKALHYHNQLKHHANPSFTPAHLKEAPATKTHCHRNFLSPAVVPEQQK